MVIVPDTSYSKNLLDFAKQLSEKYKDVCYVSLNKPYGHLIKSFEDHKIDKNFFFFIDAVTRPSNPVKKENYIFISSISALTDLSIAITKTLETRKYKSIIFDSLSTMLIYHEAATVTKFMHSLIGEVRAVKCIGVFTCLEGDVKSSLIKDLGMFVDEVVKIKK